MMSAGPSGTRWTAVSYSGKGSWDVQGCCGLDKETRVEMYSVQIQTEELY